MTRNSDRSCIKDKSISLGECYYRRFNFIGA